MHLTYILILIKLVMIPALGYDIGVNPFRYRPWFPLKFSEQETRVITPVSRKSAHNQIVGRDVPLHTDRNTQSALPEHQSIQPQLPEHCLIRRVCEDFPNYPQARMDKIIAGLGDEKKYLTMDKINETAVVQRSGAFDMPLCKIDQKNITVTYPRSAQDKNGKWRLIVNNPETPVQGFEVEICEKPNQPCDGIACFQMGYEGLCEQKFIDRLVLVTVNETSTETEFIRMPIPSCCSCVGRIKNMTDSETYN